MSTELPIKKRTRISKHVEIERNFVCECGSKYLSRGALASHKKNKHYINIDFEDISENMSKGISKHKQDNNRIKIAKTSKIKSQEFKKLMERYLSIIPDSQSTNQVDVFEDFPKEVFKSSIIYNELFNGFKNIENLLDLNKKSQNSICLSDIIIEADNLDQFTVWETLALFCYYMSEHLSSQFYKECVVIVLGFGVMIKTQQLRENMKRSYVNDHQEYFLSENTIKPAQLPEFANQFLMDYYIPLVTGCDIITEPDKLIFFGIEDVNIFRAFLVMYLLCKWLYVYKFTKLKLDKFK